jgi:Putative zinc-finger
MMNCFEARQDFVSFWRGALDGERRRELLAHLMGCAKCDRAFRTFALTAPMLHSGGAAAAEDAASSATQQHASRDVLHSASQVPRSAPAGTPIDLSGVRSADADRAAEILRRASVYRLGERRPRRAWRDAAAGLSAVAAAVLLAYFSIAAPSQSFDDILANSDSISETAAQPDTDFLGQQMPAVPTVSNDLAG